MAAVSKLVTYLTPLLSRSNRSKLVLAVVGLVLFHFRGRAVGTRRRPDLKGPWGLPLIGNMLMLSRVPPTKLYEFLESMTQTYGPIWSITLPFVGRMVNADSPEAVEHVLKTNFWAYEKGENLRSRMGDLFGNGIFTSDGDHWRFQRKLASHIFNVRSFREYTSDVFVHEGLKLIDFMGKAADSGSIVDLHHVFLAFTLDSFGTISFGKSFGCLDDMARETEFAVSFDDLTTACSLRLIDPLWKLRERVTSAGAKMRHDRAVVGQHALSLIELRRRGGVQEGTFQPYNVGGTKKDLLQLFMECRDDDGEPLSDEFIKDIILNFTIAGRDTTAQALTWMFYCLLRQEADPKDMAQLVEEVDQVLPDQQTPTYESHRKQKFAEACLYETLRLYPVVPRNLKTCIEDDVLPDGTQIRKGDIFTWSSWVMGRQESIWGPDAKFYRPGRWINADKPSQAKFNSFHTGPRVCLGQQFATIEALTMIALILQRFTVEMVDPKKPVEYDASVTLPMANGLPVRLRRRPQATADDAVAV
ncbi:hypothetical protein BGZ73_005833 [Actinomortierella ambigua]|nr:hypothetical protein BGZ73_005833 [Actinomortierella ambigua]